jgi:F-type H+-transporting ATPase subunit delta
MAKDSSFVVSVTSAVALSAKEKEDILAFVTRVTGNDSVVLETQIDSSILAGLRIEVGDTVLDTTVSEQLQKLTKKLLTVS